MSIFAKIFFILNVFSISTLIFLISKVSIPPPSSSPDNLMESFKHKAEMPKIPKKEPEAKPKPFSDDKINVVFALDPEFLHALPTVMSSIWNTTKRAVRIFIVFVERNNIQPAEYLSCFIGDLASRDVHILPVNASQYIEPEFVAHMNRHRVTGGRYTAKEGNYIRFYFQRILPKEVEHIIYLDVDVLVLDDIGELWDFHLSHRGMISGMIIALLFTNTTKNAFQEDVTLTAGEWAQDRLGMSVPPVFSAINTGVLGMRMGEIREKEAIIMERLRLWAVGDTKYRWLRYDTQYLINLAFINRVSFIPRQWNIGAMLGQEELDSFAKPGLLHYYGPGKPWMDGPTELKEIWKRYERKPCSGHGQCSFGHSDDMRGRRQHKSFCQCVDGYSGELCEREAQLPLM